MNTLITLIPENSGMRALSEFEKQVPTYHHAGHAE